jgi:hypothetical protein
MRKELLAKIIKEYEGENWCISKHLLASSMRLMEVGTKMLTKVIIKPLKKCLRNLTIFTLCFGV